MKRLLFELLQTHENGTITVRTKIGNHIALISIFHCGRLVNLCLKNIYFENVSSTFSYQIKTRNMVLYDVHQAPF